MAILPFLEYTVHFYSYTRRRDGQGRVQRENVEMRNAFA